MSPQVASITRERIVARIEDWKTRLEALRSQIEDWAKQIDGVRVVRLEVPQAREELMQRFHVEPEGLPAIALVSATQRVSFVPLALWVIGANGRVNITTNKHSYILVDDAESPGDPALWMIVNPARRRSRIPLTESAVASLLQGQDLFA